MPSDCDNQLRSANIYVDATKKIIALFKKDLDHYWDLRSIQRKLGFMPNDKKSLDDSEIQFLLETLVNYGYIEAVEQENTLSSERSLYYKLPYKRKSWSDTTIDIIVYAVVAYVLYKYLSFKYRYLYSRGLHPNIPYVTWLCLS